MIHINMYIFVLLGLSFSEGFDRIRGNIIWKILNLELAVQKDFSHKSIASAVRPLKVHYLWNDQVGKSFKFDRGLNSIYNSNCGLMFKKFISWSILCDIFFLYLCAHCAHMIMIRNKELIPQMWTDVKFIRVWPRDNSFT